MVKVIDFKSRTNESGQEFFALIVQGGAEPIRSAKTGKLYFSAKTASVPSTFDEATCQSLIGCSFEGSVRKVACDPYNYTIGETGEVIELSHCYEYMNEELTIIEDQMVPAEKVM